MLDIRLACHMLPWNRDNLPGAVADIGALGYAGFETFDAALKPWFIRRHELEQICAQHGVRLVACYCAGTFLDPAALPGERERILSVAAFLGSLGADRVVLGGSRRRPEGYTADDYRRLGEILSEIGRATLAYGVRACFHPHWDTAVQHREELDQLMAASDPAALFLAPDTAHLIVGGADPVEVVRAYGPRVAYLHLKDVEAVRPGDEGRSPYDRFVEPGEGIVDWQGLRAALEAIGYQGWATAEVDRPRISAVESARRSKLFLDRWLG